MNYRHIYHAGNFADVMKHALLIPLIRAMQRKDKPFLLLDTHAGIGRYDVRSEQAEKTGEWRDGIGKLLDAPPPALAEYVKLVRELGLYPGSPALSAALLRPTDRLIACELHPEDAATLRRNMRGAETVAVHERDGYEAISAFLPPPEKRALVLIDPPFERTDEFAALEKALLVGWRKFKSGVFVVWYPVKHRGPVRSFFESLKLTPIRDVIAVEFLRRPDINPLGLNGCGLLIVNPPYGFEEEAAPILAACEAVLGEPGCSSVIERVINE
ncbi:23S rRNA (adenine(2030)-N(6))-methyltransferase RlmJ [Acidocella aromatica]|uniref:Ribosomal RNA large subunit methyltransferase J n=1 Tax=Acidocella aromatica TaxID=1303579 RepID=A0A840VD98_9PROT|nr:23S rRNA (adenine(2030)-N(6))-methyltransferase RlmJ [Acidocella aromatica]MBB5373833.1 23S rRNA (adenine2030-N6)-methyltransferase [Acidocella aromatica]